MNMSMRNMLITMAAHERRTLMRGMREHDKKKRREVRKSECNRSSASADEFAAEYSQATMTFSSRCATADADYPFRRYATSTTLI